MKLTEQLHEIKEKQIKLTKDVAKLFKGVEVEIQHDTTGLEIYIHDDKTTMIILLIDSNRVYSRFITTKLANKIKAMYLEVYGDID